ncbi:hypothetical protein GGTG_02349 [Gaeumannomyces tritici R3-111a-1]|uniref:PNPLA domain-containing protein n=1 Tax=Gaeumannomyces tritici (strain R3-111a-1) TaxID=644352 RepID=J3NM45_GAET3|nr:hypothetical protein GGTG_02349 [Gaeumannomyces tritici R3-111a-1]EJT82376.1 hypothetical protein GGTG_02349 [Gaeumannomyces tritici R3-111a-1]
MLREWLEGLLDPKDDTTRNAQYTTESEALWLAVAEAENGGFEFLDHQRYPQAVDEHRQRHSLPPDTDCYPMLASFTGNSGAGKSALINLLMMHPWDRANRLGGKQQPEEQMIPVIGIKEGSVATSTDIHLCCDPIPTDKRRPLLFADCEGFHAGESDPAALRQAKERGQSSIRALGRTIRSLSYPGIQEGRQAAVAGLYPKLLYNMADVFVHAIDATSVKSLEEDIASMLQWAQSSQKAAVNRAILPHLIIVLNRSTTDGDWDPAAKTAKIFHEQSRSLDSNKVIREERQRLDGLGQKINTLEELLNFSYASVRFIKLPPSTRPVRSTPWPLDIEKEARLRTRTGLREPWTSFLTLAAPASLNDKNISCVNKRLGHGEKHQNARGASIGIGGWMSLLADSIRDLFLPKLREHWKDILHQIGNVDASSRRGSIETLHREHVRELFKVVPHPEKSEPFSCVWCMGYASHETLPCGHRICKTRIPSAGDQFAGDSRVTEIKNCDLHKSPKAFPAFRVLILPNHVGRRILTLDGGGVRGLVELVILAELTRSMGVKIKRLYDTGALQDQLQSALGNQLLSGARTHNCDLDLVVSPKVFVTAVEQTRRKCAILATIMRPQTDLGVSRILQASSQLFDTYASVRTQIRPTIDLEHPCLTTAHPFLVPGPNNPLGDFAVWEAARVTSAATKYFNSFRKKHGWFFWDGALAANNPFLIAIFERARLSMDSEEAANMDMLLSVGTGRAPASDEDISEYKLPWAHFRGMFKLLKWFMTKGLDAEFGWNSRSPGINWDTIYPRRYFRLNPEFTSGVPEFDDVAAVKEGATEASTREYLAAPECRM